MNNTLKQLLCVTGFIFLYGWLINFEEITGVLKQGLGFSIMCFGIIMAIGVFFPLSINVTDKVICIFWAGAFFVTGASLHGGGMTWAILACSIYLIIMACYFSPIIESRTCCLMISSGITLFIIGILLIAIVERSPALKAIDHPTEKPYVEDKYEYDCIWDLYVTKWGKKPGTDYCHEFYLGRVSGALETSKINAKQMMEEWERKNTNYTLLNKDDLILGKNIIFVRRASKN